MITVPKSRTRFGTELPPDDRRLVLAAFVHRYTREHVPAWARRELWVGDEPYPVQFDSDAEWLAHTRFAVRSDGRLDRRVHSCHSEPTFPDHPHLRRL